MNNHTPGTWKIEHELLRDTRMISAPKEGGGFTVICLSPRENDAPLLVSAPDLLEALKELVGNSRPGWQEVNVSRETIDKALAAISKAEGK